MATCEIEGSYIKVQSVSFFYIVSPLFNALGPSFNQLCDCAGMKMFFVVCATMNAPHFSLPCHLKNAPFNCIFLNFARCMGLDCKENVPGVQI